MIKIKMPPTSAKWEINKNLDLHKLISPDSVHDGSVLDDFFTPAQYAKWRGVSRRTIDREAAEGRGAPRIVIGRQILYRKQAVKEWLLSKEKRRKYDQKGWR